MRKSILLPQHQPRRSPVLAIAQLATGQTSDDKLGKVSFETSCTAVGQAQFNRAMLYQHSFWYRASQRAFEEVLKSDPACSMAHWGVALSLLGIHTFHRR